MKRMLIGFAVLALALTGCRSAGTADVEGVATPEQCAAEVRLGDKLLNAIIRDDYAGFRRQLAPEQLDDFPEKDFKTSRANTVKQFGEPVSARFLTALTTPSVVNLIWVVSFERKDADGKLIRQDMLFRLVSGQVDGRTRILGLGFL